MSGLAGKTVVVAGASGVIGRATVEVMLERGADVLASDLAPAPPRSVGADPPFFAADARSRADVDRAFADMVRASGGVDAVALAFGCEGPAAAVEDVLEADVDDVFALNVKGCLFWMQAAIRHMKAGRGGSIVAVSSISGVVGAAALAPYAISKHALIGLVRTAALEAGRYGVRVNAVCPGPVDSDMMRRLETALSGLAAPNDPPRTGAALSIPTQRFASPREVACMTAFLCGDDAGSCNGGVYMVDGGYTAK